MRPRELLAMTAGLVLLLSAGILAFAGDSSLASSHPAAPAPEAGAGDPELPAIPAQPIAAPMQPRSQPVRVSDGDFHPSEGVDTTGWTSGEIRGDLVIASSVRPLLQSVTVLVQELRNENGAEPGQRPWQHTQAVTIGSGTPTFTVRDVPFSKYGYVVRAYSPGLNGGQQTVNVSAQHPCEDSVQLVVSAGTPYTILLRDQDMVAVTETKVLLVPIGEPPGRPRLEGTSDNYGSVVFETVLSGDYQVYVGHPSQPLIPPELLTVQTNGGGIRGGQVQSQGRTLTVPRGVALSVYVHDTLLGYGIEGVTVRLTATDRSKLTVVEQKTDLGGIARLEHLLPGSWQIDVFKDNYQRRSDQITVKKGEEPPQREFALVRLR